MSIKRDSIPPGRYWILLALLVKGIMILFLIGELGKLSFSSFAGIIGGDTRSYLDPIENLISGKSYDPDYRMPGYGAVYYLIRLWANGNLALNILLILQYFLASLSVYVLALTVRMIFKSDRIFYLVYFTFLLSSFTSIFDIYILTESFTISSTIFAIYFLIKGIEMNEKKWYFFSGLLITWAIFLRPVYLPFLLLGILICFIFLKRNNISYKSIAFSIFYFLLPFIFFDTLWIIRNYNKYEKVLPLTKSKFYPGFEQSSFFYMMKFLQSWGGNYIFWDTSAEIRWFGIKGNENERQFSVNEDIKIPSYIYTSKFNEDSLLLVKKMFAECNSDTLSPGHLTFMTNRINEKLNVYTLSIEEEHPVIFYITSRLVYLKKFLIHSGTYNIFKYPWSKLTISKKIIKVLYSIEYLFILITGMAGIYLLLIKPFSISRLIFPVISLYGIIIFPMILRLPEIRYFAPTFPFLLVCSMYFIDCLILKIQKQKI